MNQEEENKYITEIAKLSDVPANTVFRVIEMQIAMALRDLGVNGKAKTTFGEIKLDKNKLVLLSPNHQVNKMLDSDSIVERLTRELE